MHFSVRLDFKLQGNNDLFYCKQMKMAIKVSMKIVFCSFTVDAMWVWNWERDWERDCSKWKRKECLRNCCTFAIHLLSIAQNYIGLPNHCIAVLKYIASQEKSFKLLLFIYELPKSTPFTKLLFIGQLSSATHYKRAAVKINGILTTECRHTQAIW